MGRVSLQASVGVPRGARNPALRAMVHAVQAIETPTANGRNKGEHLKETLGIPGDFYEKP